MTGYRVEIDSICTHNHHSGEQFGEWSASYTNTFKGVSLSEANANLRAPFTAKTGAVVYVVWAEWSSGDSFGSDTCGSKEELAIFQTHAIALEYVQWLQAFDHTDWKPHICKTSDGQEFTHGYLPWQGYFESLEGIYIETCTLGVNMHEVYK